MAQTPKPNDQTPLPERPSEPAPEMDAEGHLAIGLMIVVVVVLTLFIAALLISA